MTGEVQYTVGFVETEIIRAHGMLKRGKARLF
jgi:hypothetical protein